SADLPHRNCGLRLLLRMAVMGLGLPRGRAFRAGGRRRPVKVAIVHSFYRSGQPSGENLAVTAQIEALSQAEVEVALVGRWSDREVRHPWDPVRVAMITATGRGGDPTAELRRLRPDLVHVHNLFPSMGTRWLGQWQGPIVATVHNYRPLCANGLLLRDGHFCTDCVSHGTLNAVRHGCYRDSRMATIPL